MTNLVFTPRQRADGKWEIVATTYEKWRRCERARAGRSLWGFEIKVTNNLPANMIVSKVGRLYSDGDCWIIEGLD